MVAQAMEEYGKKVEETITLEEFGKKLRESKTKLAVLAMFLITDKDGDGRINVNDYLEFIKFMAGEDVPVEDMKVAFNSLASANGGFIGINEFFCLME